MKEKGFEGKNYLNLVYKLNEEKGIKIFGYEFVKNNKNKCHLIIEDKKKIIDSEYIDIYDYQREKGEISFKLVEDENETITDMSHMFENCDLLERVDYGSSWDCKNVLLCQRMFYGCTSVKFIYYIFNFISLEETNFNSLFFDCKSLRSLIITDWNTKNVTDFSHFVQNCSSLEYLGDGHNFVTSKAVDMSDMFNGCAKLNCIELMNEWDVSNVTNMDRMFYDCKSLINPPSIDQWNPRNLISVKGLFCNCSALKYPPKICYWKTYKLTDMSFMFKDCHSLTEGPDMSNWDVSNVENMYKMFENCSSMDYFPDVSRWKLKKNLQKEDAFKGCKSKVIPRKLGKCVIF